MPARTPAIPTGEELERLTTRYEAVFDGLAAVYGRPVWHQGLPPVDELVATILSQATSDANTDKGYSALKDRYPDWEAVMDAPLEEVVATIHSAGLANQKAPRIQEALRAIYAERGAITLEFLTAMSIEEAEAWLTQINGVGRKTAAIVLLFAFGRPAFPVDTHVHRIAGRVGLIPPRMNADKAHRWLAALGDPDTFYPIHLNLIRHGREVCRARAPQCDRCPIRAHCDYAHEHGLV